MLLSRTYVTIVLLLPKKTLSMSMQKTDIALGDSIDSQHNTTPVGGLPGRNRDHSATLPEPLLIQSKHRIITHTGHTISIT